MDTNTLNKTCGYLGVGYVYLSGNNQSLSILDLYSKSYYLITKCSAVVLLEHCTKNEVFH